MAVTRMINPPCGWLSNPCTGQIAILAGDVKAVFMSTIDNG
jgi:hypothetical protein